MSTSQQRREDEKAQRRETLIDAAEQVFAARGFDAATLDQVARQARVSRALIYLYFADKAALLEAFGIYEREMFETGIAKATAGLRGNERVDAAMQFIVAYQRSYSGVRVVDIEPEVVIARLGHIIPDMRAQLEKLLPGPNGAVKAATAIRVAVSHYIVRSDDDDQFLAQLRHAVGIKTG